MQLDHYYGPFAYFVLGAEILLCLYILYYFIREAIKLKKAKKAYFKEAWNIIELVSLIFAVLTILCYVYRLQQANELATAFSEDPDRFHNFQYLGYFDDVSISLIFHSS